MSIAKKTESYEQHFGQFIIKTRQELGLTSYALANNSGIALNLLRYYEKGERIPTLGFIVKISYGLGLTPSELFRKYEIMLDESCF